MGFQEFLFHAAKLAGFSLTSQQLNQLEKYYQLLISWNEKMNLTAITEPEEVAVKHMVDSLLGYDANWFPQKAKVIDVGTGAGFPGLVLKIFRPDLRLTLLDSLNKRLVFLAEVIDSLGLSEVELIHDRAEDAARKPELREQFAIATSRAVARLNVLSEYCLPFVQKGGYFLAFKGREAREELAEATRSISLLGGKATEIRPVILPELDAERFILAIQKKQSTPKTYPRRPAAIEKKPL